MDFPGVSDGKASAYNVGDPGSIPRSGRSPGEGNGNPLQYSWPGKSHGWKSLVGYSPWGRKESDTTERLSFFIGEGNGNPLQCSCLENPRDRGAWWAAVYGVAQSQTRLKRLSSSSSSLGSRRMSGVIYFTLFPLAYKTSLLYLLTTKSLAPRTCNSRWLTC